MKQECFLSLATSNSRYSINAETLDVDTKSFVSCSNISILMPIRLTLSFFKLQGFKRRKHLVRNSVILVNQIEEFCHHLMKMNTYYIPVTFVLFMLHFPSVFKLTTPKRKCNINLKCDAYHIIRSSTIYINLYLKLPSERWRKVNFMFAINLLTYGKALNDAQNLSFFLFGHNSTCQRHIDTKTERNLNCFVKFVPQEKIHSKLHKNESCPSYASHFFVVENVYYIKQTSKRLTISENYLNSFLGHVGSHQRIQNDTACNYHYYCLRQMFIYTSCLYFSVNLIYNECPQSTIHSISVGPHLTEENERECMKY